MSHARVLGKRKIKGHRSNIGVIYFFWDLKWTIKKNISTYIH